MDLRTSHPRNCAGTCPRGAIRPLSRTPPTPLHPGRKGAVLQVTAGSFAGAFGEDVRTFAVRLAENGWVHLVASDAHRASGRRGFYLREAYRILEGILGTEEVLAIHSRAEGILDGREISAEEGEPFPPVGKKGVFFARLKNLFGYNQ